jgi:hypothetical protein
MDRVLDAGRMTAVYLGLVLALLGSVLLPTVMVIGTAAVVTAGLGPMAQAAAESTAADVRGDVPAPPAPLLQWTLAGVAVGNFLLGLSAWHNARHKAATARLESFEADTRAVLGNHAQQITRLKAEAKSAITHTHLSEVYQDIKGLAEQVHTLAGQQQEANSNLRLLVARLVRGE